MGLRTIMTGVVWGERKTRDYNMLKSATMTIAVLALSATGAAAEGNNSRGYNWVGLYVGGTVGYGFGSSETFFNNCKVGEQCAFVPDGAHPYTSNDPSGFMGGLTVGYNWAASDKWVYGVEADISMADIKGKDEKMWGDGHRWRTGWDGMMTLRGRAGWKYDARTLIYGTAGIAAVNSQEYNIGDEVKQDDQSSDNTGYRWGWVAGAGVERAITDRWTGKVEYLHVGMNDNCGHGIKNEGASVYCYYNDLDIIRAGVNYKMN
jgi:outer membrane immunogenic protein